MNNYADFFNKFGGSYRTKNLIPYRQSPYDLKNVARFFLQRWPYHLETRGGNKRFYNIPESSALPLDYIRLCPWEGEYLYILASRSRKGMIETGRFHGGSTFLLASANNEVPIYSIDINPLNDDLVRQYFSEHQVGRNVDLIIGDSQNVKYPQIGEVDLLFIDGDHSYEGCTRDLENWYPNLVVGGHVVLHDCYYGSPVQDSVIDFMARHSVEVVQTPYVHATYWHAQCGSITHFIKKA